MAGKILVTGGSGYLGSILVPELLDKGYWVTVLDNLMYDQTSLLQCCANPKYIKMIQNTFGPRIVEHIKEMTSQKLERKHTQF